MDKIKNLIKDIIKASDKFREDTGLVEQLDEVKALANELDYTVSHYKKPKIYVFKSNFHYYDEVVIEWNTTNSILHRDGYKIEIVKMKKPLLIGGVSIYYRYIEV